MFASKDLFFSKPSGYQISRSVRLRSSASANLNRTFTTPTSNTKWTFSGWLKRGTLGSGISNTILGSALGGASTYFVLWWSADSLAVLQVTSGATVANLITTQVFRDPSAWYHITMVWDSGNATSSSRILLYVNGVQVTSFSTATYPSLNLACSFNQSGTNVIGYRNYASDSYYDGYLTEINFIDGQALTPSSFGQTNTVTGVWQPIKYTGTYGTNGFYLNFSDNSAATAAAIGKDYSGNGNNWTPNNISVTAGTTYDSMLDVPTLYADGGNGRGNYAVINPLIYRYTAGNSTFSNGNLTITGLNTGNSYFQLSTIAIAASSGKFYWENILGTTSSGTYIGITQYSNFISGNWDVWYDTVNGNIYKGATLFAAVATAVSGDNVGVAYDSTANTCAIYKNNTLLTTVTGITAAEQVPLMVVRQAAVLNLNFGQQPFTYTPPTGYVALNTQNLPTPTISNGANYMAATTYTGTGSAINITNGGNNPAGITFKPDLVWGKVRNTTGNNLLFDSLRGTGTFLISNTTAADGTNAQTLTAFNSNGYSYGTDTTLNTNANTYVAWQWQAGAGTSSSNTSGSITSTVSVGATQGFSVVTYTGNGTNGATVGHGLGVAPKMVIGRRRDATEDWPVYHASLTAGNNLRLNSTQQQFAYSGTTSGGIASVSSAVVTTGQGVTTNGSMNASGGTYVAYCFSEVAGYSKAFSFTGNGSADGIFSYLGFRPRMVLLKRTDTTGNWYIWDTSRNTYNVLGEELYPNLSNAGATATDLDLLSNGFKMRNSTAGFNASGGTYIGFAWAENPFKYSLGM